MSITIPAKTTQTKYFSNGEYSYKDENWIGISLDDDALIKLFEHIVDVLEDEKILKNPTLVPAMERFVSIVTNTDFDVDKLIKKTE